jgi:FkbM family methyltransferase
LFSSEYPSGIHRLAYKRVGQIIGFDKKECNGNCKMKTILHKARAMLKRDPDRFLRKVSGVIHVGATTGQERNLYANYGLRVIWIEPIPEVFEKLKENVADFSAQRAVKCLVTDQDNMEYPFHIANNNGHSSSILDLNLHKDIWPQVDYEKTIMMKSKTLSSLLEQENIDCSDYDALIMDTQGSELLVLKGAAPILENFLYIKTEVPDFESYTDCCQLSDIASFLARHGYREFSRHKFAKHPNGGSYYDVVFKREA